jgi:beta-N-acetylhexosaminidase
MRTALITGVSGEVLTPAERDFLKSAAPAGLILFSRNCRDHAQIRALVDSVKEAVGSAQLLVLIDQEGGRVQRLRPPLGRALPPADAYARIYDHDRQAAVAAARHIARLVAEDLSALGINTNCTPVLDLPAADGHAVIGDRAFGTSTEKIAALGRAVAEGFLAGGVLPVIKHIPGHGRATKDSHFDLPVVTTSRAELSHTDFSPFKALNDMPAAMTAHVVFTDIDPNAPASASATVTAEIIRGEIGFDGLLMSDDLSMKALSGPMKARAEAVIRSGSDLALHCSGDLSEMDDAASAVPALGGEALRRLEAAEAHIGNRQPFESGRAEALLTSVLSVCAPQTESV